MIFKTISKEVDEDGNRFICPVCGFDYVHPQEPIFSGEYEDSGADYTITIPCWCEEGHKYSIIIYHHKGQCWIKAVEDKS